MLFLLNIQFRVLIHVGSKQLRESIQALHAGPMWSNADFQQKFHRSVKAWPQSFLAFPNRIQYLTST